MAKATSAKKVARVAAKSGGTRATRQRNWLFPAAIVGIVAVGLGIVVFARSGLTSASGTHPLANLSDGKPFDHWHASFAIDICGKELPALQDPDPSNDPIGIHTHGDGLIHIHPFVTRAAGKGATMGRYWDKVQLKATDKGIQMPDGRLYAVGKTTCNGVPGVVRLAYWKEALKASAGAPPTKIITSNFTAVRFLENYEAFTLSFGPANTSIKPPSTAAKLKTLGECDGAAASSIPECANVGQGAPATAVTPTVPATVGNTVATSAPTKPSGQ